MSEAAAPAPTNVTPKKDTEVFRKYISTRKIVICDESASNRTGVYSILTGLGAKPTQMKLASTLASAEEEIKTFKPDIVLVEYDMGKGCGLELLQGMRNNCPDLKKSLFMILTGNTSQTAVARAAEEDIDGYIIKPFTPEVFRNTVMKTALTKIHPPAYIKEIDAGKVRMLQGDIDGAEEHFKKAMGMDPKPSLAMYYLGQAQFFRKAMDGAQQSYEGGLGFNKIHYKCLVGLYELLLANKMHEQAYEVVKKVSQYFPANPKRLTEVLRLAIVNKRYDDVERYYGIFCNIDTRNEVLINYICAALVVCAKYYLHSGSRSRALELLQKAAVTSAGRAKFIREIVQCLLDYKMAGEATQFLARYPMDARNTPEYLLLDFQCLAHSQAPGAVLTKGRELLGKGITDERFFDIMIGKALEAESLPMAESLFEQAAGKFPAVKERYYQAIVDLRALKRARA